MSRLWPYRIVTTTVGGGRRVFYASRIRLGAGMIEADGAFHGGDQAPIHVSIPMTSVNYIEEARRPAVKRGWVRPRLLGDNAERDQAGLSSSSARRFRKARFRPEARDGG